MREEDLVRLSGQWSGSVVRVRVRVRVRVKVRVGARGAHLEGGHAVSRVLAEREHEQRGAPVTRSDLDRTWLRAQHHLHDVPGAALGGVVQRRKPLVEASSKSTSRRDLLLAL